MILRCFTLPGWPDDIAAAITELLMFRRFAAALMLLFRLFFFLQSFTPTSTSTTSSRFSPFTARRRFRYPTNARQNSRAPLEGIAPPNAKQRRRY